MEFLFHSVYHEGNRAKYYNVYKIENNKFYAECHHFNRVRECEGDFELVKEGEDWKPSNVTFRKEAEQIADEIQQYITI